jgi:chromate reductase, NAD(P)H dehydrogenase (quinone)
VARILLISGSTRHASTNSALVRTAVECAPAGVDAIGYDGLTDLPHFNPDDDREPLPHPVAALRAAIAAADAVLFCTPEYAGTLPGSVKNLLDWTVGGTTLTDKPVAWVNAAADPRRGAGAHATLATVLGYVQARVVDDACRHVPVAREAVGTDGRIADAAIRSAITEALAALVAGAGDPAEYQGSAQ